MADIRRLVSIDQAGTVTTLLDLESSSSYQAVRGSFEVRPPEGQTAWSQGTRRYQGALAVSESHQNGEISWKALVRGTTADQCLQNIESMVAQFQPLPFTQALHVEWRPDGATFSTFYEVRGPAKWKPAYDWAQFTGAKSMLVDVTVPVAPLAKGARTTQSVSSFTTPNVVQLGTAVGGTAPARMDLQIVKPSGTAGPAFGMVAWWPRQGTPPSGFTSVFGVVEAESGANLTTWSSGSDAGARGGNRLAATVTTAGTATATYKLATQGIPVSQCIVDVEVWARVYLPTTIVSPRLNVQFATDSGSGPQLNLREWGAAGKPLNVPTSTGYRVTRLGIVTLPLAGCDNTWKATVTMSWATSASSTIALDWLCLVPAASRACSPTGEPLDSSYPRFMNSATGAQTKVLTADLGGSLVTGSVTAADTGLGGAALEPVPGNTDMLVMLDGAVPDAPPDGTASAKEYTSITATVGVTSRYFLVRGS